MSTRASGASVFAVLCSLITTWVTFLPCFLFIFVGGPHIEGLGRMPGVGAALGAITAAVVGVILNLGVKFSEVAIFPNERAAPDWFVVAISLGAFVALRRFKIGLIPVIVVCGLLGLLSWAVGLPR